MINLKERDEIIFIIRHAFENNHINSVETKIGELNIDKYQKLEIIRFLNSYTTLFVEEYDSTIHATIKGERKSDPDLVVNYKGLIFPLELKSAKLEDTTIPGSSINSIDPEELTIFWCKSTNNVACGVYGDFMTGEVKSHDRAPRVMLKFKDNNELSNMEKSEKEEVLNEVNFTDYEKFMGQKWFDNIFKKLKQKREGTWFNKAICYFTYKVLTMSAEEQAHLRNEINTRYKFEEAMS